MQVRSLLHGSLMLNTGSKLGSYFFEPWRRHAVYGGKPDRIVLNYMYHQ